MKSKGDIAPKAKDTSGAKGKDTTGAKTKGGTGAKTKGGAELGPRILNHLGNLELTDDLEADISAEDAAMKRMLKEADNRYAAERELVTETEYWVCLVFESREQKEKFLKGMGWWLLGDKYLDGTEIARRQNIPLPIVHFPDEKPNRNKRFDNLVDESID